MRNNYRSEFNKYKAEYKALREQGLIKKGQRQYGYKKFTAFAEAQRTYEGLTTAKARRELINAQKKFGELTEKQIERLYNKYKAKIEKGKELKVTTVKGKDITEEVIKRKFRTKETFMKNMRARDIIASLIDQGRTKREALEEYGYKQDN